MRTDAAFSFCEGASYVGCCTVFVVCQRINNNGGSAGAVAFVGGSYVVDGIDIAGCFFDAALDGVVGHVVGFCFCDYIAQSAVVGRVCTALFYGNSNFTADDGKDFTLGRIIFLFFVFDIGKF